MSNILSASPILNKGSWNKGFYSPNKNKTQSHHPTWVFLARGCAAHQQWQCRNKVDIPLPSPICRGGEGSIFIQQQQSTEPVPIPLATMVRHLKLCCRKIRSVFLNFTNVSILSV